MSVVMGYSILLPIDPGDFYFVHGGLLVSPQKGIAVGVRMKHS